MPDIMIAVQEAVRIARDDSHGYSQKNRTGNPDYDCSSLVIHCLDYAGFPMSKYGATYTGNMKKALQKCGFENVKSKINMRTGDGMQAGDVFLNEQHHTAIAISGKKMVAAHDNYDGKKGDSSGKEIDVYSWRPYSRGWGSVWRYRAAAPASVYKTAQDVIEGKYGNGQERIEKLKAAGHDPETVQKAVNNILKYMPIIKEVASGKYGNGKERKDRLTAAGLPYELIQELVNAYMKGEISL